MSTIFSRASEGGIEPPLPQAAGYAVVVVVGFFIAFVMIGVTYLLRKTVGEDTKTTEMFMTANRRVGTGLTASAVISSWLWSTAMLGSCLVGYNYGVAGPFWFAAGYVLRVQCNAVAILTLFGDIQMLPHDSLLCSLGYCMQDAHPRSAHTTRDRSHPIRTGCPRGVDRTLPDQQHHRSSQHAARSQCGHLSFVRDHFKHYQKSVPTTDCVLFQDRDARGRSHLLVASKRGVVHICWRHQSDLLDRLHTHIYHYDHNLLLHCQNLYAPRNFLNWGFIRPGGIGRSSVPRGWKPQWFILDYGEQRCRSTSLLIGERQSVPDADLRTVRQCFLVSFILLPTSD